MSPALERAQRLERDVQALWVDWIGNPLDFAAILGAYVTKAERVAAQRKHEPFLSEQIQQDCRAFDLAVGVDHA